jgi:hypothetical protein
MHARQGGMPKKKDPSQNSVKVLAMTDIFVLQEASPVRSMSVALLEV